MYIFLFRVKVSVFLVVLMFAVIQNLCMYVLRDQLYLKQKEGNVLFNDTLNTF